jgi:hypothetical protein
MKKLCGKMVKRRAMTEPRPCIREVTRNHGCIRSNKYQHGGLCSPDLTGMTIGGFFVLRHGRPHISSRGTRLPTWVVRQLSDGLERTCQAANLLNGTTRGVRSRHGCGGCCRTKRSAPGSYRKPTPEYMAYNGAKGRCQNPRNYSYPEYGDAGVEFRFASFVEFIAEVGLKPEPKSSYSLAAISTLDTMKLETVNGKLGRNKVRRRSGVPPCWRRMKVGQLIAARFTNGRKQHRQTLVL